MRKILTSNLTGTGLRKSWGDIYPSGWCLALLPEWHNGEAAETFPNALELRNTRDYSHLSNNSGPEAPPLTLFYRAKESIGGSGPAKSTLGTPSIERAGRLRDLFRHAVRDRLTSVALALLVLVVVVMSPIQRSSSSSAKRPPQGLRRNFALPASDSSRLSVNACIMREDAVVSMRSEDDEDEDESCSATRQAYDIYDRSLSNSRSAPARNLSVPSLVSALHPLRC